MANKIIYGLSNVHVYPITETSDAGVPTYGTTILVPGAVNLSMDAAGETNPFYADDTVYFQTVANNGYEGTLEVADIPEDFLTTVMKEITGSTGTRFENADAQPLEFAMAFEFQGDEKKRRHLFYRCKATRPSVASQTKEASISPNTQELKLTAMPRLDTRMIKARCEEGDADFASWYTAPVEYTAKS